ncbi:MAG: hypothetical protein LUO93_10975 [Methanomicrobiales archaeon]|nr:hypothetical protein [Methanomicrobiales archaeon]
MNERVESAGASIPDRLCLFEYTSRWNLVAYLAVDREIPNAENMTLSGRFFSKMYEGPFEDTGKWTEDFHHCATHQGMDIKRWYIWYTTCPTCAKKYGKNYVAIIAEIS